MIRELHRRDPLLFCTGGVMLLLLVIATLLSIGDPRLVAGINPWIKPMKFMTSITIFLWTVAWFMPDTEPRPRARAMVRWTIASAMAIEIVIITMQAWRGTTSHFNVATLFDGIVFQIMGAAILLNTAAMVRSGGSSVATRRPAVPVISGAFVWACCCSWSRASKAR